MCGPPIPIDYKTTAGDKELEKKTTVVTGTKLMYSSVGREKEEEHGQAEEPRSAEWPQLWRHTVRPSLGRITLSTIIRFELKP